MTRKFFILFAATVLMTAFASGCEKSSQNTPSDDEQNETPSNLAALKLSVPDMASAIFDGKPSLTVSVMNPNDVQVAAKAKIRIISDMNAAVTTLEKDVEVPAGKTKNITFTTEENLAPGFYKGLFTVNDKPAPSVVFGVSPFEIESAPDKQDDFDSFWEEAKAQLPDLTENEPVLTEITSKSSSKRKVYLVEMLSVPDGPDGEPVVVRGYYLEPQDGKKHPVIMHYFGYDDLNGATKVSCPSGGSSDYAEFYLSTRGQMVNNRKADKREPDGKGDFTNIYGDWFAYGFGDKDTYYYRGAFMDCVQAVRFMATRPTSDMNNLFAEGSSQGGAFSYAAAALSDHPFTAIAPCVAFLGDFPDYFDIVSWPGNVAKNNQGSMSDEQMYAFLSYFDTKNLATRLSSTAVIACSGLLDGTCPPHTNIAPYNNLPHNDKEYHFYPKMKHEIPSDWAGKYMKFFKERMTE